MKNVANNEICILRQGLCHAKRMAVFFVQATFFAGGSCGFGCVRL